MTSVPPKNLRELVNDAILHGLRGQQVDAVVCALGGNVLDPAKPVPFLSIKVLPAAFECFQDGQKGIVFMNWVPRFVSIYPPCSGGFPIARVYQFSVPDLLEFAHIARSFEERGFGLKPMLPEEFEVAIEAKGHEERVTKYCEDFPRRAKESKSLLDNVAFASVAAFEPDEFASIREYFRRTGDRKSLIWVLSPVQPSPLLRGTMDIAHGKERYRIIDQFAGRQPVLLNYDSLVNDMDQIAFIPTLLLDSNVVADFYKYVTQGKPYRSSSRGIATGHLLKKIVSLGWDYNPTFYHLETLARNVFEKTFPHALEFTEAMFQLHTMDEAYFLESGEIRPDEKQVTAYMESHNVKTFSELSERHLRDMATKLVPHRLPDILQVTYACLLKAGILNCKKMSQRRKMEQFVEFLHTQVRCFLLREALVAGLHFRSKAGNLIPIHPNYKKDFRATIMASSWDIMLLRMPELFLSLGQQQETTLAYVCTGDRTLASVGAMFTLGRYEMLRGKERSRMIFYEDVILPALGTEIYNVLFSVYKGQEVEEQVRTPLVQHEIAKLVSSLEDEASNIMGLEIRT